MQPTASATMAGRVRCTPSASSGLTAPTAGCVRATSHHRRTRLTTSHRRSAPHRQTRARAPHAPTPARPRVTGSATTAAPVRSIVFAGWALTAPTVAPADTSSSSMIPEHGTRIAPPPGDWRPCATSPTWRFVTEFARKFGSDRRWYATCSVPAQGECGCGRFNRMGGGDETRPHHQRRCHRAGARRRA